jgi:hypothetical protein
VKKSQTLTEFFREACRKDPRNVFRLSKDSGVPTPVLYRFVNGNRGGLSSVTLDRLAQALDLEIVPRRRETPAA